MGGNGGRWEVIVIGLTGNIACGKSTVAKMLEHLGATLIDADKVVHEQMAPGASVWQEIVAAFGRGILNPDETINRGALASIVFNDPAALKRLEGITHPAALRAVEQRVAAASTPLVVVEAVKLIEAGWATGKDSIWVVTCSEQSQIERMMRDRGMTEAEARERLSAQPSLEAKLRIADVVIDNSGSREATLAQVEAGLERLRAAREARDTL